MVLSLGIVIIFTVLMMLPAVIKLILQHQEVSKRPVGALKTLPKAPELTVKQILDATLKYVPQGCMWNVEKHVKTYRKVGEKYLFDGTASTVYVSVALIAPGGPFKSFSIPLEDHEFWLHNFQAVLKNNVQLVLKAYGETVAKETTKNEQINDDWDGVYS